MTIGTAWAKCWNKSAWAVGAWFGGVAGPGRTHYGHLIARHHTAEPGGGQMTIFRKWIVYQDADEKTKQTISWSARMMDGDTIATVTNTPSGVTISSETNTTTSNSYFVSNVSGASGYVTTEIVTAAGETLQATKYFHEITA